MITRLRRFLNQMALPASRSLLLSSRIPTFDRPISQLVSGEQIRHPEFERCRVRLGMRPGLNRKLWEYTYILRVLECELDFSAAPRLLGFGVGKERLPAVLAAAGAQVLATDYPGSADALNNDWSARSLDDLRHPLDGDWDEHLRQRPLCPSDIFERNVRFEAVDMTRIPDHIRGYDGLWSCGSLEHIGGLRAGIDFVVASLDCLRPGGVAVHTTEFNVCSDEQTYEDQHLCFYRRRDILELAHALRLAGHHIELTLEREATLDNMSVDRSPFDYNFTINAQHGLHVITSVGLVITKGVLAE